MTRSLKDQQVVKKFRESGGKGEPANPKLLLKKWGIDADPRSLDRQIERLVKAGRLECKSYQHDDGRWHSRIYVV